MKIVLIHGNGGATGTHHWFPYVKNELEKNGHLVLSPNFPDSELARAEYWLPFLENEIKTDSNTVLIGHSSGAVAIMRYTEKFNVLGSVLVGASYTDLGDENERLSGYFDKPWIWDKIKNNQKWILQFASTDDPYIPISEPRFIHQKLDTKYFEYSNKGHFMFKEFPEMIIELNKNLREI